MAFSGYGFAGDGAGKAEPVKPQRLTPVTATPAFRAERDNICRLYALAGIHNRSIPASKRWPA